MRRRAVDLELALTHDEFQGLKRLRKAPVDFREAPFIVEEVFVRHHRDLFEAEFWSRLQERNREGEPIDFFGRFDGRDPAGFPGCCNPTNLTVDGADDEEA